MTAAATAATSTNSILQNYLTQQAQNAAAATASSTATSSTSSSSATGVFNNEQTFLNILTTQLKNQDPSDVTDTNQFTQELVEFAGVEQQLNTNSDLTQMLALQKNSGTGAVLSYMGQYVEAPTTTGQMSLQSGTAEIGYTLPATAQDATITIKDSSGNVVNTLTGGTASGLNYLSWNGQDSSGNQLPDGAYTFSIAANDTSGNAETITDMRVLGKVTGVTSASDGTVNLSLGTGVNIGISTVDAVFGTSASNMPTATNQNTTTT